MLFSMQSPTSTFHCQAKSSFHDGDQKIYSGALLHSYLKTPGVLGIFHLPKNVLETGKAVLSSMDVT